MKKSAASRKKKIAAPNSREESAFSPVGAKPHIRDGHVILLGDCLDAMTELRDQRGFREQVDLIYLDPPFNSKAEYSFIFGLENAAKSSVVAFTDSWQWESAEAAYDEYVHRGGQGADFLQGMRRILGASLRGRAMLSYLTMMVPRLEIMRELLTPTGSIFLHCDHSAGSYLKCAMDAIFGMENCRNDILWCYTGPGSPNMRQFNRKTDYIFWYSKGKEWTFNRDAARVPHKDGGPHAGGFRGGTVNISDEKYAQQGKILENWWADIAVAVRSSKERLGYPTQKPLKLLRRIVEVGSHPGDIVLDPFCGCGTTLAACVETRRNFVGIDLEPFAAEATKSRMAKQYEMRIRVGHTQPKTEEDFSRLAADKRYRDFQYHAISLISGAFPNPRQSGDEGVDGWIFVRQQGGRKAEMIVISVKAGGQLNPAMVRELRGVVEGHKPKPLAGILITLGEPTAGMISEAERAGQFTDGEVAIPRIQILPIRKLLEGRYRLPHVVGIRGLAKEFRGLYAEL